MKKIIQASILLLSVTFHAQMSTKEIDALVQKTMKTFSVPGMAVAVVKDNDVIHAKGYGVRSIKTQLQVDTQTLFGIASNSKAFTATALAILIDEGKLDWDDKVVKYIPEFKMYDDYVTQEFTLRDLLTHRSGLGLGAGDLMIWPEGNHFTKKDIVHNLRFLKPVSSFRSKFDYDNLLYIVAGEIIQKVSQLTWAEFVEQKIMLPLQMNQSKGSWHRIQDTTNVVTPHVLIDQKLRTTKQSKNLVMDAAGGIFSNIDELALWVKTQLRKGKYENKTLFSEKQHQEMWAPQTLIPTTTKAPYHSHYSAYGLGWFITDVKGYKQVSHTGGLEGMVTQVTLIPEINLGIIVLTNQQSGAAFQTITNTIKNTYLKVPHIDYISLYSKSTAVNDNEANKILDEVWNTAQKNNAIQAEKCQNLVGKYTDVWFGDIEINFENNHFIFKSLKSPNLTGEVFYHKENTYAVKWYNRSMEADAFIELKEDNTNKNKHLTMKAISPLTDFSYDFQDLYFTMTTK